MHARREAKSPEWSRNLSLKLFILIRGGLLSRHNHRVALHLFTTGPRPYELLDARLVAFSGPPPAAYQERRAESEIVGRPMRGCLLLIQLSRDVGERSGGGRGK